MSELCPPAKADDLDTSARSIVPNDGESQEHVSQAIRYQMILHQLKNTPRFTAKWFGLKEEEMQFRSHSSIIALYNSSKGGEFDDVHVDKANVEESGDQHLRNTSTNHPFPPRGEHPPDTSTSEQTTKYYVNGKEDSILNEIASSTPSPETNSKEWIACTGHMKSPPIKVLCNRDAGDDPVVKKITGLLAAEDVHDEPPPVPFISNVPTFKDGTTPKVKAGIETMGSADYQGLPIPICVRFADTATHDKLSQARKRKELKSEESASSKVLPAPALPPPTDYLNHQDEAFPNPGVAQQSKTICPEVNKVSGLHLSPPLAQGSSNLAMADTNMLSQSLPNEHVQEQEDPAAASIHALQPNILNGNQPLINPEVSHQPRSVHASININYGLHTFPPATQGTSSLSGEASNVLSQALPNECVHEEEDQEDMVFIAEAFLVPENVPEEGLNAEVTELVERDPNLVSFRKCHVCMLTACIASFVIALGISLPIYFFVYRPSSSESIGRKQSESHYFSPSSQPSFVQPSSQPSLSIRDQIDRHVLQRHAVFDGYREMALDWIMNEDKLQLGASDSNLFQRYILVLLWYEFMSDAVVDWLSEENECEWPGVECTESSFVNKLDLSSTGLKGTIPPEIVGLVYLENITLSNNSLFGTLPSEIGQLTFLTYLDAKNNNFDGTLPSELGILKELSEIDLLGNRFTGSIPSEFKYLRALSNFSLTSNAFSGTFPWWIGTLTQMTHLRLGHNKLTGSLPSEIGNLRSLIQLELNSNALKGSLPSEIGSLQELTHLNFWSNDLGGSIPSEFGNIKSLIYLDMGRNSLTGTIPSEIGLLSRLFYLDLGDNYLGSSIPSEFGKLKALGHLLLGWCQLTGSFPSEIGNLTSLTTLNAAANQLNGKIPTTIGNLKSLEYIELQENRLTGSLPSKIGSWASLTTFNVARNLLNGSIPTSIGNFKSLQYIALHDNQMTGTIPSAIGNLVRLIELWLWNNKLTGTLPSEIGNLTSLGAFSVGPNSLSGTVPTEFGNLEEVWHLSLGGNNFTGTIPTELGKLTKLDVLLIEGNQFTGHFPSELKTCSTGLSWLCTNNNQLMDPPSNCGQCST